MMTKVMTISKARKNFYGCLSALKICLSIILLTKQYYFQAFDKAIIQTDRKYF